jgi:hypothetical protein
VTFAEHVVAEIRAHGPLTGEDFQQRMRARPGLTFWQRVRCRWGYVELRALERRGVLTSFTVPRTGPRPEWWPAAHPWHRYLYRESGYSTPQNPHPPSDEDPPSE